MFKEILRNGPYDQFIKQLICQSQASYKKLFSEEIVKVNQCLSFGMLTGTWVLSCSQAPVSQLSIRQLLGYQSSFWWAKLWVQSTKLGTTWFVRTIASAYVLLQLFDQPTWGLKYSLRRYYMALLCFMWLSVYVYIMKIDQQLFSVC